MLVMLSTGTTFVKKNGQVARILLSTLKLTNYIYTFSNKNIHFIYIYSYKTFWQLIQVNQNKQNISMFVFLNSKLHVLEKLSFLNDIAHNKKYLYRRSIDHKSISVREYTVYYLLLPQQIPIHVQNISTYRAKYVRTEIQCFVHTFYINDMDNSLGPIHEVSF